MDIIWWVCIKCGGYIKYSIVGMIGFGIHILILWVLTEYALMWYMLSAVLAIVIAALNNYILNYLWTFKEKKHHIKNKITGYFQYLLSRGVTEGLYLLLLFVCVDIFHIHYVISAIVIQIMTAVMGYVIAVKWIWRRRTNQEPVMVYKEIW